MANPVTGRTVSKFSRVYYDGYDVSGYTMNIGPLDCVFDTPELTCISDGVKGYLSNHPSVKVGTLNGVFDPTSAGLHVLASAGAGSTHIVTVAIGIQSAPTMGHPAFTVRNVQSGYSSEQGGGGVTATVPFGEWDATNEPAQLAPWGWIYHAAGNETAVNTAIGFDDGRGASTKGGLFSYHIFSVTGTGNVTVKIQEADTNTNVSFADLTDATSGLIAHTAVPCAGIVATSTTAAVKQFLRWQIVLGAGITGVNFLAVFARG